MVETKTPERLPITPQILGIGTKPEPNYEGLIREIKELVLKGPTRTSNQIYYFFVVKYGYDVLKKKGWDQRTVYATIRKMRDEKIIGWNDVAYIE